MSTPDAPPPRWPLPTAPHTHDPVLFARAMRDMRLTWRARGILAELATGYPPGQEPKIGDLVSLNRDQRVAAEGRAAFSKAVGELRAVGYLVLATTRASGVGERLVVDLTQAADARMISEGAGWSSYTDGS